MPPDSSPPSSRPCWIWSARIPAKSQSRQSRIDEWTEPQPFEPAGPDENIFIPFLDPIAPVTNLTFTFRKPGVGGADPTDIEITDTATKLRDSSAAHPLTHEDPDDDTKEFRLWWISETAIGWTYQNADGTAADNHGVLFVKVGFYTRRVLESTNIAPNLDRNANDNGSLVNVKLLKSSLATLMTSITGKRHQDSGEFGEHKHAESGHAGGIGGGGAGLAERFAESIT